MCVEGSLMVTMPLSIPHSLSRPSFLPLHRKPSPPPRFSPNSSRCSSNLTNSRAAPSLSPSSKDNLERFARISFSIRKGTSSVGANPQLPVPPPSSQFGWPFWVAVGVGLSALFSWVVSYLQVSLIQSIKGENYLVKVFDKLQGKGWRRKQVRKITDKVFDRVRNQSETVTLTFEDLYIAVLLVYNDINKRLPCPHIDPPSKEEVRSMIQECDMNLDGEIDREEFSKFIQRLMGVTFIIVSQGLILTLVVAPMIAMATKKATEGVPGIGKVVQKLPYSIYASIVTLAAVLFQKSVDESD